MTVFIVKEERLGWCHVLGVYENHISADLRVTEEFVKDTRFDPSHYYWEEYEVKR